MAEILGVIASGASIGQLAIQIIGSVQQILDFWSTVRDAPENVQALLKEIDLLGNLLSEIIGDEEEEQSSAVQHAITRVNRYCQAALENIDGVLKDLASGLTSSSGRIRQWTAVKAAMKEKRLEKSLERLERAKSLLNLAYQYYIQWKVKALQDFQRQKFQILEDFVSTTQVTKDTSTVTPNSTVCSLMRVDRSIAHQRVPFNYKRENSYWFVLGTLSIGTKASPTKDHEAYKEMAQSEVRYIRLTNWISQRAFELFSSKIYGRWQHSFRSYRIFTFDDPIYLACVSGDVELANRLCVEGQATPYDTTLDGWSLLHVAATFAHPLLCQWLISKGADGNASGTTRDRECMAFRDYELGTTPLAVAVSSSGRGDDGLRNDTPNELYSRLLANGQNVPLANKKLPSDVLNTMRILIEHAGSDPMIADACGYTVLHHHTGSLGQFSYLLNQEHFQVDLLQRDCGGQTVSEHHACWRWSESPKIARLAWERETVGTRQKSSSWNKTQDTFIHGSSAIDLLHRTASGLPQFEDKDSIESALLLIRQLMECGTDPHAKLHNNGNFTPLASIPQTQLKLICDPFSDCSNAENSIIVPDKVLSAWIKTLRDAGVEIKKYMIEEEEQALQRKKEGDWRSYRRYWPKFESRVEWEFHHRERAEDCFISATCEVRRIINSGVREIINSEVTEKIPGAWKSEFDVL